MKYKGASGNAKEIIMIVAFGAGLIVVFYMLAKREAESALSGAGKAVSDAVTGAVNAVTNTATGVVTGTGQAISQVVSLPPLTENNVTGTLAEDVVDIFTPIGYPTHKLYKDGKWYILYGCDKDGYNCTSYREPLFPGEGHYLPEASK